MAGNEIEFKVNGNQFLLKVGQVISDISDSNLKQIIYLFDDNGDNQINEDELEKHGKRINSIMAHTQSSERYESRVKAFTGISQKESIWSLNDSQNLVNTRIDSLHSSFSAYEYDLSGNLINCKYQTDISFFEYDYEYDEKGNKVKTKEKQVDNNRIVESEYDETDTPVYTKTIEIRGDGSTRSSVEKYVNDKNGNEILRIIDEDNNGSVDAIIPYWQRFSSR